MTHPTEFTTPCLACGYDLKGLRDDAPCPECGLAVDISRHSATRLTHEARRALRRAARLTLYAVSSVPVIILIAAFAALAGNPIPTAHRLVLLELLILAALCVTVVGVWRLTAAIPSVSGRADAPRLRTTVRVSTIACAALVAIGPLVSALPIVVPATLPAAAWNIARIATLWIAVATAHLATIAYIRWLALAVPSRALRVRTRSALRQGVAAIAIATAAGLAFPLFNTRASIIAIFVSLAVFLLPVLMISTYCSMLAALINRLKNAEQARPPSP